MRILEQVGPRRGTWLTFGAYLRSFDWLLFLAALAVSGFGLAMIYSATHADPGQGASLHYVRAQSIGLALGIVVAIVLSLIDYERYARWHKFIYAGMILLLVLTLIVGEGRSGAHRWIALPFFEVQSAEVSKVLIVVTLAAFLADGVELRNRFRFVLLAVGYVVIPIILVYLEPDLGTALVFAAVLMSMFLVWGIHWRHAVVLATAGALGALTVLRALPAMGVQVLKDYQLQRLMVFLNPEHDTSGWGYQLTQSRIAVASGMYTGKGFMEGTQTHLNFLPEHHTDFIFSVIGEELGFLGAMILLGLYLIMVWRMLRIAGRANSLYGSLIAAGVAGILVFQVFVNVGMTIGIMPVTGVPLPFVSFGSSSLVVFWMAVGILESVQVRSTIAGYSAGRVPLRR
ncbi:MAG: rod shape-determining protein RodA [Actinobacteria bacterium]|nr:rod shape-determining protein RodA [Actinomycetota bacterium]